jgi:hypothetical protein
VSEANIFYERSEYLTIPDTSVSEYLTASEASK